MTHNIHTAQLQLLIHYYTLFSVTLVSILVSQTENEWKGQHELLERLIHTQIKTSQPSHTANRLMRRLMLKVHINTLLLVIHAKHHVVDSRGRRVKRQDSKKQWCCCDNGPIYLSVSRSFVGWALYIARCVSLEVQSLFPCRSLLILPWITSL